MPDLLPKLLDLAIREPESLHTELVNLGNLERKTLLDAVATGNVSRGLSEAFGKQAPLDANSLALGPGVTVFLAKTSLPALPAFELHMFEEHNHIWGRTVFTSTSFLGPGYFGVISAEKELILDFALLPPANVIPKGWPPVVSNAMGLGSLAFTGVQLRLRGTGKGLLTGSVWRNGRDQGAFVNMVCAR